MWARTFIRAGSRWDWEENRGCGRAAGEHMGGRVAGGGKEEGLAGSVLMRSRWRTSSHATLVGARGDRRSSRYFWARVMIRKTGSPSESFCHSLRTSDRHPPSPGARLHAQLALSQIDADHGTDKGFFSSPFAVADIFVFAPVLLLPGTAPSPAARFSHMASIPSASSAEVWKNCEAIKARISARRWLSPAVEVVFRAVRRSCLRKKCQ